MSEYARGGPVFGSPQIVKVERIGQTAEERCVYSIDDGPLELIISAAEVREMGVRGVLQLLPPRIQKEDS